MNAQKNKILNQPFREGKKEEAGTSFLVLMLSITSKQLHNEHKVRKFPKKNPFKFYFFSINLISSPNTTTTHIIVMMMMMMEIWLPFYGFPKGGPRCDSSCVMINYLVLNKNLLSLPL